MFDYLYCAARRSRVLAFAGTVALAISQPVWPALWVGPAPLEAGPLPPFSIERALGCLRSQPSTWHGREARLLDNEHLLRNRFRIWSAATTRDRCNSATDTIVFV